MPRYDYRCTDCACILEEEHSMSETREGSDCPVVEALGDGDYQECYGTLKRVFTPTPAVFRGQGWAKMTEYKPKGS